MILPQKVSFGPEACEIEPKVVIWSCPDLLLTEQIKRHTRQSGRPIGAPPSAAPVFLIILYHKYLHHKLFYIINIIHIYIYIS